MSQAGGTWGKLSYVPALDGLRAIAAIAVLAFHSGLVIAPGGFLGVDAFFVLSGFLITRSLRAELSDTGTLDFAAFFYRRLARLWPALVFVTLSTALFMPFVWPTANVFEETLLPIFYLTDFSYAWFGSPGIMAHTWSLSIEMQFYLIWAVVVFLTRRLSASSAGRLFLALFIVATIWRSVSILGALEWNGTYYRGDTRISGLLLGCFLASRPNFSRPQGVWHGCQALAIFIFCVALVPWGVPASLSLGTLVVEFATLVVIGAAMNPGDRAARLLSTPVLVTIGRWSYSLYLWHFPIALVLRDHLEWSPFLVAPALLALCLPLAAFTHHFIEMPIARWARPRSILVGGLAG